MLHNVIATKGIGQHDLQGAKVLVVGDAMLDRYWFGEVERISPEAPVPIVLVEREEFRLGGAANVARNVASLGCAPTLATVVGNDEAAARLRALLDACSVSHDLHVDMSISTTVKLRVSGRSQQLLRIDFERQPSQDALVVLATGLASHFARHRVVIFSDYGKGSLGQVQSKIALALQAGCTVLVDPKGSDWEPYRGAALVTPNRAELAQVTGPWRDEDDLATKVQALRSRLALGALLVTRSEEGMTLFDDGRPFHVPAQAREVFDVTGAGDTVIATIAALVASGASIREAVPFANRAGGIVVGRFGTSAVTAKELFA